MTRAVAGTLIWLLAGARAAWAGPDAASAEAAAAGVPALAAPAPTPALADRAHPDPIGAQRDWEAGLARLRAEEIGEAMELLKSANAKDPDNAAIASDLGLALMKLGARREAELFFRRALQLEPRRAAAYANLAELVADGPERWQRRDEILALLKKGALALRDDPRGRTTIALAAAVFEQRVGHLTEARRLLEELLAQKPSGALRKRVLDQVAAVADQERALALADWPEPPATAETRAALRAIDQQLAAGDAVPALARAVALTRAAPGSTDARFACARAEEALGRYDQATRTLTVLLQLRPSRAEAWRLLGTILAQHGGALEAEHADQALRRALALEPSWDDLRALRRRVAERRTGVDETHPPPPARPPPSPRAQALFEEAERLLAGDTPEAARAPLAAALAEAPGFVDAAAAFVALTGEAPAAVVQALWNDGDALAHLAGEALRARPDAATTELARPWLDRAVALGVPEALFQRALLRADEAETAGALADLAAYVGAEVSPPHLAEAGALRRNLEAPSAARSSAVTLARELLLADSPREAVRVLGGPCRAGLAGEALVQLGRIAEYEGRTAEAIACHRLALAADPTAGAAGREALDRIARLAARLAPGEARPLGPELSRGEALGITSALWGSARLAAADGRGDDALALGERFLAAAPADDPMRIDAEAAVQSWRRGAGETRAARLLAWRWLGAITAALVALLAFLSMVRRRRSRTVAAAVVRVPDLFPDVAAAVGEIRHDVLKHRTSALSLLGESVTAREEIRRALLSPSPASAAVAAIYDRLRRSAAGAGVSVRPLAREPVFGPLVRALAQAEKLIARPGTGAALAAIDRQLRECHGPALGALLLLAPATVLDGARLEALVAAVVPGDAGPAIDVPAQAVAVPLPPPALHTIVSNLLRNALEAAGGGRDARVVLRVRPGRDATGRRTIAVLVADSAPATVTLDEIDRRDGQRGLGVVRDLVRRWGGQLVIAPEPPPLVKGIGAAFPVAPPPGGGQA